MIFIRSTLYASIPLLMTMVILVAWASSQPNQPETGQSNNNILSNIPTEPVPPEILKNLKPDVPPTIKITDCTTSGCHADQINKRFLHGPTAVGACTACHQYENVEKHIFRYERTDAAMCTYCHINIDGAKHLHQPVAEGKCLDCHNPHGAAERFLPRKETIGDTCLSCHDDLIGDRKHIHTPVAALQCTDCHNGHSSSHRSLLREEPRRLCLSCHIDMKRTLFASDCVHAPVQDGCLDCHDPHASDNENQIIAPPADLCGSCHQDVIETATNATVKHSVVLNSKRACLNCHNPHTGDRDAELMRDKSIRVCLTCHDKEIKTPDGKTIHDVVDVTNPNLNLHGPLRAGECRGCHQPHGSDHRHLLPSKYDKSFYTAAVADQFDLCFNCHTRDLIQNSQTKTATRFRNGNRNLHALHINDPKKAGRNCGVCHSIHASTQPFHMNLTVKFGQWTLPIRLKTTDTGGTCAAGCHRSHSYDRENPVIYEDKYNKKPVAKPAVTNSSK